MRTLLAALALPAVVMGCDGTRPMVTSSATSAREVNARVMSESPDLVIMTQNIGPGTNVDPILYATDPSTIPFLAAEAWATLQASDMPGRALAVAALIDADRPALVGLQEVTLYRIQHPSDAIVGGTTPATTVLYDYLQLLLDALHARGAEYRVAVEVTETDAEVPMYTGGGLEAPTFDDVRYTDRDVILVRGDLVASHARGALYRARLPFQIGGKEAAVVRGWGSVDVTLGGRTVRFFSTHLEDQHNPPIQLAQAEELAQLVHASPYPAVVVGDLNSAANVYQTETYGFLTGAGKLADAWPLANPGVAGLTCCHPDALNESDWSSAFDQRLDLVLLGNARSSAPASAARQVRWKDWDDSALQASVVGLDAADRTASGLWASDHAGVVARLRLASRRSP